MIGQKVRVYRNLNKPGMYSIKIAGKVVGYAPCVELSDIKFIVSEASRQRVLRDRQRNVHAYAEGVLVAVHEVVPDVSGCEAVTYSPYVSGSFFNRATNAPVSTAAHGYACGANVMVG
jgi:hypothetical protein